MAELYIIPECYVDTNLIETLVPTAKGYNHQKGCNNVVKVMKEKLSDKFAVGIVDKDKRQVSYVNEFAEIGHTDKAHFLIMIDPAVDRFILKCAKEEKVEMKQFDLSDELRSFTAQTKQVSSKEDTNFKKLFHEIKSAEEITILRNAIKYLKEKQYSSNSAEMKALIDGQTSKL